MHMLATYPFDSPKRKRMSMNKKSELIIGGIGESGIREERESGVGFGGR